jgi:hypothetical protein
MPLPSSYSCGRIRIQRIEMQTSNIERPTSNFEVADQRMFGANTILFVGCSKFDI